MNRAPQTANATFSATLCDQLWVDGLTDAYIAPGSRSTPVALALVEHPSIKTHVFHDERAASFAALGHGLSTGRPALVLCSSGTAGAHFYAAVIEADASAVPLLVITADRPPELWGRGAPQTIDQTKLFGTKVRAFAEPGPPDDLDPSQWRHIARDLFSAATGAKPGPVHANLSFRDPLTGSPDELPPPLPARSDPDVVTGVDGVHDALRACEGKRGVIVAGKGESDSADVLELAARLRWPILADHRSGCRDPQSEYPIRYFDALLRDASFGRSNRPDVVMRLGEIVSSKALSQWLSACAADGTEVLSTRPHGRHIDPEEIATMQFDEAGFVAELVRVSGADAATDQQWLDAWTNADGVAHTAVDEFLSATDVITEVEIAQQSVAGVPSGGSLVVSSSMPVRDVEWFGPHRNDIAVFANRGANGIDGIVSTAIGVALTGSPTVCLIGDVAFLHDATSLVALRDRTVDLTIVVTNNDGGGIFSFLPQHDLLPAEVYEALFGTPHGTDLAALVSAHGLSVEPFDDAVLKPDGVRVVIASTDRLSNLTLHNDLAAAVSAALSSRND